MFEEKRILKLHNRKYHMHNLLSYFKLIEKYENPTIVKQMPSMKHKNSVAGFSIGSYITKPLFYVYNTKKKNL